MKSYSNLFFAMMFGLLVSCSCGPDSCTVSSSAGDVVRSTTQSFISSGTPVTIASLGIEGMSCEKMCGGTIKKALESTEGVISAEIQFDAEKEIDVAIVKYRAAEVGDADLISVVHGLRNGIYKVRTVNVDTQVKKENASEEEEEDLTALVPGKVRLPSLMDLLSAVLDY